MAVAAGPDARPIAPYERDGLLAPLTSFPLALLVSGGSDSMALMQLVAGWRDAGRHRTGPEAAPIIVLTIDHGLRPEAACEAQLVAQEARRVGLPCRILTADEPAPATGVQEWARDLRLRLVLEALDAEEEERPGAPVGRAGAPVLRRLVMAHHRDDQAETVLMRLARGSGLRGLGGMQEVQTVRVGPRGERRHAIRAVVHRPLLGVAKSRLIATLEAAGVNFIHDRSNEDERFERVRVRKALRILEEFGIGSEAIARSAERLRGAEASLGCFEEMWRRELVDPCGGLMAIVPASRLGERGQASAVRLLEDVIAGYGGAAMPAGLGQVESLLERIAAGDFAGGTLGGCRIEIEGGCRDGRLLIYREGAGEGIEAVPLRPGEDADWDGGRFRVSAGREATDAAVEVRALRADGWARLKREVMGLGDLRLRAAAMATMPAIWSGSELVALPFLDRLLAQGLMSSKSTEAWKTYRKPESRNYEAVFAKTSFAVGFGETTRPTSAAEDG